MYSKCNQLLTATSLSLQNKTHSFSHRITNRLNSVISSTASPTFKYSANINNKDCLRLAVVYGMCGTFASYLSMNYDGKVLVFKWSVPTPERFVFCAWCWALGGMASWSLFWTKPDALIRAASSRIRYGLFHGTQTTTLSLLFSFSTVGFWSMYFDFKEWQHRYAEWQKSVNPSNTASTATLMTDITNTLIEEEGNEEGDSKVNIVNMDEMEMMDGVQIMNSKLEQDEKIKNNKSGEEMKQISDSKPALTLQIIANNMYEPCKLFFMCNAPIWLICGNFTGIVAARMLTNAVLLNPVNITTAFASMCYIDNYDNDNLHLLHDTDTAH